MIPDRNMKNETFSWLKSILIIVAVIMLIRTFLFTPYKVEGVSMEPTLRNQERILVSKSLVEKKYNRGDIVIIKGDNSEMFIKRIIGVAGDKIEVKNNILYINDVQKKERYLDKNRQETHEEGEKSNGDFEAILIPENEYFVMGDNRLVSMDSRNGLGLIKQDQVIGQGKYVFYPFTDLRKLD
nr:MULTISPECIES: signal peptidase I [unclassified Bacillus (in: firmicutes)]